MSVPIITGIVENTKKKALESSLWAIDSATKNYYSKLILKNNTEFDGYIPFKIANNACATDDVIKECLDFESENIREGYVSLYSNNSASICIDDGKYYANKSASDSVVEVGNGRCTSDYSDETKKYLATTEVTVETINTIEGDIADLKARMVTVETENSQLKSRATTLETAELENAKLRSLILENDTAGLHNSVFRGKDIISYYNDGSLYKRIAGTDGYSRFEDLYVGDYFTTTNNNKTITWRIAGFDILLKSGSGAGLTTHHAVIVPDDSLITANMNDKVNNADITTGGFAGSKMYTTVLPSVLNTYIVPIFDNHAISFSAVVSSSVNNSLINQYGTATGASSGFSWKAQKLLLMSEEQLYGMMNVSSSAYDVGTGLTQFPLFYLEPSFIISKGGTYWLASVANSTKFVALDSGGHNNPAVASTEFGVRPYFLID